ncbi:MAG: hypothetical protein QE283_13965 [Rhodoferax sp.]|nr:hypothetical protein [Rhodoferax sp.]
MSKRCGLLTVHSAGRNQGGADARAEPEAGGNVAQIYAGLIKRGPALVRDSGYL